MLALNCLMPLVPLIFGLRKLKKIDPIFYPFLTILGCAFLAEVFRFFQLLGYYNNLSLGIGVHIIGYNLYIIAISLLYSQFFYNLGHLRVPVRFHHWIMGLLGLLWIADHFFIGGYRLPDMTKVFRLSYSFLLCIIAIVHINKLLVEAREGLLKNSSFLICTGILFFYTPYIVTEGIFLFLEKPSTEFYASVILLRQITIILMNSIFLLAVLWMPQKKRFIQLL